MSLGTDVEYVLFLVIFFHSDLYLELRMSANFDFFFCLQFILEQLCNIICPTKPEPAYMMVLNKAHTQEEFIRGSMTKNPYSSLEIGPLMRDVKNKICRQLELLGLVEDDYGMELLVAGNIIALDLSVAQVLSRMYTVV